MTALTDAHLEKLTDEDLRAIALRALNDAVSALDISIEEDGLTDHPDLDPAPVQEAVDWLRGVLNNPDDGYNPNTWKRHRDAVGDFTSTAHDVGASITGDVFSFPSYLNAVTVRMIFSSTNCPRGTPHRPAAWRLHDALVDERLTRGFIPGHETTVGYVLKAICDSDDPRLPALAESYMQSGLQENLRPAIDEATNQLALLDELADLNH